MLSRASSSSRAKFTTSMCRSDTTERRLPSNTTARTLSVDARRETWSDRPADRLRSLDQRSSINARSSPPPSAMSDGSVVSPENRQFLWRFLWRFREVRPTAEVSTRRHVSCFISRPFAFELSLTPSTDATWDGRCEVESGATGITSGERREREVDEAFSTVVDASESTHSLVRRAERDWRRVRAATGRKRRRDAARRSARTRLRSRTCQRIREFYPLSAKELTSRKSYDRGANYVTYLTSRALSRSLS